MDPQLGYMIADGVIKALLLGVEADKVREAVRPLSPEQIPAALEQLCENAKARAHAAVAAMPE